jgi:CBS domain-containing protein
MTSQLTVSDRRTVAGAMPVSAVMTTRVATLDGNDTLDIADGVMAMARFRHLPVVEHGRVVGVVSQRDLFRSALAAALGFGRQGQTALLKSLRVKEVMSEPAVTIAPEASIADAARAMVEHKIGCLPVVAGGTLAGIVTESDLLRQLAGL